MTDTRILLLGNAASDSLSRSSAAPGRALTRIEDPDAARGRRRDHDVSSSTSSRRRGRSPRCAARSGRSPSCADVPILAISSTDDVEERIRLLEAGADDVMIRPVDERELDARVEALDLRHRRSRELRPSTLVAATAPARPPADRRVLAQGRRRDDDRRRQRRPCDRRARSRTASPSST